MQIASASLIRWAGLAPRRRRVTWEETKGSSGQWVLASVARSFTSPKPCHCSAGQVGWRCTVAMAGCYDARARPPAPFPVYGLLKFGNRSLTPSPLTRLRRATGWGVRTRSAFRAPLSVCIETWICEHCGNAVRFGRRMAGMVPVDPDGTLAREHGVMDAVRRPRRQP